MNANTKPPSEAERSTIPQHLLDRIENEWNQMRANAPTAPRPTFSFSTTSEKS
jgi:hypothetical protein